MKHHLTAILSLTAALLPSALMAEEAAGGHYKSGATATFIDALPGKPAFVAADAFTYYHGSASITQPLLFGGSARRTPRRRPRNARPRHERSDTRWAAPRAVLACHAFSLLTICKRSTLL